MIWNFFTKRRKPTRTRRALLEAGDEKNFWYTPERARAAEAGDARAQSILGTAYHEGLGVERDPEKAVRFWLSAALQGDVGGITMVAVAFETGGVVDMDLVEAAYWSHYGQSAGNILARAVYRSVSQKLTDDQHEQVRRMLKHRPAEDREKLFERIRSYRITPEILVAGHAGDVIAQLRIGTAFHEGAGAEKNPERAFGWFLLAAMQRNARAQARVAEAFDIGAGVAVNKTEAAYWAMLCSSNGDRYGDELVKFILPKLDDTERQQALDMLHRGRTGAELKGLFP